MLASAGLALLLVPGLAWLACSGGYLFSGISTFAIALVAVVVCTVVTTATAIVLRRRQKYFGWRTLFLEVAVLSFVAIGILSWLDTRQALQIFMAPSPVPKGLRVHQGRCVLFNSYVHFTGPADAIAALIESKGLVEVPAEPPPETSDYSAWGSRERMKDSWGWWQPATMSQPKFFFLSHPGQQWCEGWWVNEAKNEVYAFIAG